MNAGFRSFFAFWMGGGASGVAPVQEDNGVPWWQARYLRDLAARRAKARRTVLALANVLGEIPAIAGTGLADAPRLRGGDGLIVPVTGAAIAIVGTVAAASGILPPIAGEARVLQGAVARAAGAIAIAGHGDISIGAIARAAASIALPVGAATAARGSAGAAASSLPAIAARATLDHDPDDEESHLAMLLAA